MRTIAVAFIVLLAAYFLKTPIIAYSTIDHKVITISKEQRIVDADGSGSRYLVWDTDGNVYENVDTIWFFKWNSSDVQGMMIVGKQVNIKTSGFRFGFMSWYPNIIKAEPCPCENINSDSQ